MRFQLVLSIPLWYNEIFLQYKIFLIILLTNFLRLATVSVSIRNSVVTHTKDILAASFQGINGNILIDSMLHMYSFFINIGEKTFLHNLSSSDVSSESPLSVKLVPENNKIFYFLNGVQKSFNLKTMQLSPKPNEKQDFINIGYINGKVIKSINSLILNFEQILLIQNCCLILTGLFKLKLVISDNR